MEFVFAEIITESDKKKKNGGVVHISLTIQSYTVYDIRHFDI